MNTFSNSDRRKFLSKESFELFDLLVIGGGITGAGIALDAQSRGLKVALVEKNDFASGTSSRSTKLIHGGLRYLKQMDFKLVAEVGRERAIVHRNGRHITQSEKMLLPFYENSSIGYWGAYFGLAVYDFLANVSNSEKRKMLKATEVISIEPALDKNKLLGGVLYYEYRTDDARLTIEILKKAQSLGTLALNYLEVKNFIFENNLISGIQAEDKLSGKLHTLKARQIINASGPWVDKVDVLNDIEKGEKLFLTKGVHIVFERSKFPINNSIYFDTADGRMIFAIPRGNKVYAGTTDTAYTGELENPEISTADKTYLLNALNKISPQHNLTAEYIESSWAGLRPLIRQKGKSPSEVSRKDEIFEYPSGLISIAGGKLTGYRLMAERVVDIVAKRFKKQNVFLKKCNTKNIKISGADFESDAAFTNFKTTQLLQAMQAGLSKEEGNFLLNNYGSNFSILLDFYKNIKSTHTGSLPAYLQAMIQYSIQYECSITLTDFFIRRTGALYFDIGMVYKYKNAVNEFMAEQLVWDPEVKFQNLNELNEALFHAAGRVA